MAFGWISFGRRPQQSFSLCVPMTMIRSNDGTIQDVAPRRGGGVEEDRRRGTSDDDVCDGGREGDPGLLPLWHLRLRGSIVAV